MAPEKSVLVCLGDNRRIVKCSSAEEGLPIVKVIKKDVLGGEVEHILIQIEELWGVRKVFVDFPGQRYTQQEYFASNTTAQSEQFKE